MEQHEERIKRLEKRFTGLVEEIDKSYFRKMQADMHRCAANCCENPSYSMERNQNCIDNCSTPLQNAQNYVQSEISRLQNRWNRCIMECNDRMRDKIGVAEPSSARLGTEFDKCAIDCIEAQLNLTQTVETKMKKVLATGNYNG